MQFSYNTQHLTLRVLTSDHAAGINTFYWENRDFLEPFEPIRPQNFYTKSFQAANLNCEYRAFLKLSHMRYWLFEPENLSVPVGTVCFSNFLRGSFQKCSLGYKLAQSACHKGYMTEALGFLIPVLMNDMKLHRIEAYVQPDNFASIRLLNRLHFAEEGYLRSYAEIMGVWKDHLLFSRIQNEHK
ncbi:MAG: GNAT family N-acetyltransferase [Clostridiaceae bacterium]|nr:GNAT family N-acetyltransferase [Clostridiaceae bacterium]